MALTRLGVAMELWSGSLGDFVREAESGALTGALLGAFYTQRGYQPGKSETDSWANSLPALARACKLLARDDIGVLLEPRLPLSNQRIDALLVGRSTTGKPTAVVVELKQWSEVVLVDGFSLNLEMLGREYEHPSQQALNYAQFLMDTHSAFSSGAMVAKSCSFLHNLQPIHAGAIRNDRFQELLATSPAFVHGDEQQLADYLREQIGDGEGAVALAVLGQGRFQPSKKVIETVESTIHGDESWHLVGEQQVAYNAIFSAVRRSASQPGHQVVLVRGAPGTGKTVIAVQLLADALRLGFSAAHSTGGKAFTTVMQSKFGSAQHLFIGNINLRDAPTQSLDLLLVDEVHRVRETSDTRFTPKAQQKLRSQMEELITAAKVTVFLLDEHQYMRPDEVGNPDYVREWATRLKVPLKEFDLVTQFRCGGSLEYVSWVDRVLGYTNEVPLPWKDGYQASVVGSTSELDQLLLDAGERGESARLVAGFCWQWSNPNPDGSLVFDVEIDSWRRPWNAKAVPSKHYQPNDHPYTRWAESLDGEEQVGWIYSAQGFEFDRVGVIWGPDLVWRDGGWVAQRKHSFAGPVKRKNSDTERLLRNAYRVLLTRGAKETRILCLDDETREHLRTSIQGMQS